MKLYEITQAYENLASLEDKEEVGKYLDLIEDEFNQKAENTVKVIKNIGADIKALRDEEKRLAQKRKSLQSNQDWLKFYLQNNMERLGDKRIKAGIFNINIQKNPPSVNIKNEKLIADDYFVTEKKLDKKKLKEDLKGGKEIDGAELTQGESLRIR